MPRSWPSTVVPIAIGVIVVGAVAGAAALTPGGPLHRDDALARLEWAIAGIDYDAARYPVADFSDAASRMPAQLSAAVETQLRLSPAAYLADAQAAADAAVVVRRLGDAGVRVRGASMAGTALTVYVTDAAERTAVSGIGVRAVVGEPAQPVFGGAPRIAAAPAAAAASVPAAAAAAAPAGPSSGQPISAGQGFYYEGVAPDGERGAWLCSVGFTGTDTRTGRTAWLTAGHCADTAADIVDPDGPVYGVRRGKVAAVDVDPYSIGSFEASTFDFGNGHDGGLVQATSPQVVTQPLVTSWKGGSSAGTPAEGAGTTSASSGAVAVIGSSAGVVGAPVCRSGLNSGWQCGVIAALDHRVDYQAGVWGSAAKTATRRINTLVTTACSVPGDSGGPIMMGQYAVGITSLSDWDSCGAAAVARNASRFAAGYGDDSDPSDPHYVAFSYGYPMVSAAGGSSVQKQLGSRFRMAVAVPVPQVTMVQQGRIAGTVSGTATGTTVTASVDGVALPAARLGSGGAFAIDVPALPPGGHLWRVVVKRGTARSDAASGSLLITGDAAHDAVNQAPAAAGLKKLAGPAPRIAGTARVGGKLVVRVAGWTRGTRFGYQWYANGKPIAGATGSSLKLTATLVAKRVTVRVVGGRSGYAAKVVTSKPTAKVVKPAKVRKAGKKAAGKTSEKTGPHPAKPPATTKSAPAKGAHR